VNELVDVHKKLRGAPIMETPLTHCTYEISAICSSDARGLRTAS
jgi:hypothetical protein